ncbi:52 kDa repressor of the inhibitor of the protein kinase-like [Xenia sp. Carnegie-2017]|uniref:52 kDa repressor of the inhibitor of the protein kinase-like n=1 Tax=Xenia sp. Carnegie-2017 TaxID=2897299 RepID=UPI001F04BFFD|nr:52 kDa repressor of the inhibitor of the protein kinase-like [Xenia sp. Carnegie-2017]
MADKKKLKGGARTHCSAVNCINSKRTRPDLSFFRFPRDPLRSNEWVQNTRRQDLLNKTANYLYNNCKLCAEHFEECMFLNFEKSRLKVLAKPTLFNIPNPPRAVGQKRRAIHKEEIGTKRRITKAEVSSVVVHDIPTVSVEDEPHSHNEKGI